MNHYETLGVSKDATPDQIKKAYRKLASMHHPDKGGDTSTFQKIQNAYDTLIDSDKKRQYDNPQPQFNNMNGFPGGFQFHAQGFDINDIFAQMFGQQNSNFNPNSQVYRTRVEISLEDAFHGTSNVLKMQTSTGTKVINVDIPKGIQDGNQLRFDKVLDNGVLVVEFRIRPHLKFERRHNDLYFNQSVSVLDLIVGTKFDFTTISGRVIEVTVPPKTQPHMQLKLSGQGMPILNSNGYGDQYILIKPYIPDTIDETIIQSILNSKQQP